MLGQRSTTPPPDTREGLDEITDAVMTASRALVAVAARSLAATEERVSLAQYRVLVVLASRGPQRTADLAAALSVNPSTATRVCDHLVVKRLIRRQRATADRREVRLALSASGRHLVEEVTRRRRAEISRIVAAVPAHDRRLVIDALRALADAAGEVPGADWALGWGA
jgi:DNA-binding MarR family transcriptional regulator